MYSTEIHIITCKDWGKPWKISLTWGNPGWDLNQPLPKCKSEVVFFYSSPILFLHSGTKRYKKSNHYNSTIYIIIFRGGSAWPVNNCCFFKLFFSDKKIKFLNKLKYIKMAFIYGKEFNKIKKLKREMNSSVRPTITEDETARVN